ncbi:MAG TPA: serine hydroxymethyltransferase [Polyangiaceae bacterium]|jgi:glycine hydroxymethyltransferase|nr:MAG: Serine hydroxymethyltransferase [Deltaproteobacteria bacterium ADurb.Bin207]HNS96013.1 serine hydroxymethyltransferase [Polyangiaceae bacterium]HNZ22332.1 serine hydroxymethyltransferase [Polyangiaceae bacterium]HOD20866.1 serine hydroxymethyltransferase [Polyangiaceae bacterium]HOE49096.1 serine hydroxymethyltransferase [Polyangiaceae bacterium]
MNTAKQITWHEPPLAETDPEIFALIEREEAYQRDTVRLIPSENYASRGVLEAAGSVLSNKYSEGYPFKRYYEGQAQIDAIEELACKRVAELFGAEHVNVQPYSGSPANFAVYAAFASPGDTVMGMMLPAGGHLTHGWGVSVTGSFFKAVQYGVRENDHLIDYDQARNLAKEHRPKILFCGATAYPRIIDFQAFRSIADEVGAILVADIAHISGLVAAGVHPSPVGLADVVTSTTHKTFRGPRGGMIMCKKAHRKAINKAVFPGLQGGPHNQTTAAIAVAAREAATPEFKAYAQKIVENAKALAEELNARGFRLVTGGTDNHLMVVDLTNKGVPGKTAAKALDRAGIVVNSNTVPFDPRTPFDPSGIRIGTPAITSRGMGMGEAKRIGAWIDDVVTHHEDEAVLTRIAAEVKEMCSQFPAPGLPIG